MDEDVAITSHYMVIYMLFIFAIYRLYNCIWFLITYRLSIRLKLICQFLLLPFKCKNRANTDILMSLDTPESATPKMHVATLLFYKHHCKVVV